MPSHVATPSCLSSMPPSFDLKRHNTVVYWCRFYNTPVLHFHPRPTIRDTGHEEIASTDLHRFPSSLKETIEIAHDLMKLSNTWV